MVEVSVVVPNYNGAGLLEKNLPAVFKALENFAAEVIVVDDLSTDHSVDLVKESFPRVRLIEKKVNEGFASTVNLGVAEAWGEVVILLNTDVRPEPDFLNFLWPYFEDKTVFAVGCLDKSVEGGKVVGRGRGLGRFHRGFLEHCWADPDQGTRTLWVSGGSSAFSRAKWLELGGMRTLYNPFYYEDIDLSWRAQKRGWQVLFEPRAVVIHEHEQGAIKKGYSEKQVNQIAYRNQFFFVWLNITSRKWLVEHFVWLPAHLIRSLLRHDWAFVSGLVRAVRQLVPVLNERARVKAGIVADALILSTDND